MSFYGWKPYVSVAARRKKAEKAAARAGKGGADLSPVATSCGAIAKTFWGKGWCRNLERYNDFANRLPRGRTYARNGSVIDLKITNGEVRAKVMGSSLYSVNVTVVAVPGKHWRSISADCSGSIDSLVEFLQGRLSNAVMERICSPNTGLFPAPKEIKFSCSCPDWASMCKHVAAVLFVMQVTTHACRAGRRICRSGHHSMTWRQGYPAHSSQLKRFTAIHAERRAERNTAERPS